MHFGSSRWFHRANERRGPFGRGEMHVFELMQTIIRDILQRFKFSNDHERDFLWSYSLGALFTDHRTFPSRTTNYERFLEAMVRAAVHQLTQSLRT